MAYLRDGNPGKRLNGTAAPSTCGIRLDWQPAPPRREQVLPCADDTQDTAAAGADPDGIRSINHEQFEAARVLLLRHLRQLDQAVAANPPHSVDAQAQRLRWTERVRATRNELTLMDTPDPLWMMYAGWQVELPVALMVLDRPRPSIGGDERTGNALHIVTIATLPGARGETDRFIQHAVGRSRSLGYAGRLSLRAASQLARRAFARRGFRPLDDNGLMVLDP